jgi:predicted DNA-binding transcriptional regulator YafY
MAGAAGWSPTWTGCRRCDYGGWTGSLRQNRGFKRREDFDLAAYAAQSFGVFQEEPADVVLRFAPEAADEAAGWVFHPSQSIEREADGALTVRFRAGGIQEMCWHLWGEAVMVLSPDELRNRLAQTAAAVGLHHDG